MDNINTSKTTFRPIQNFKNIYCNKIFFMYAFFFIFYLWLALQIPYTHDDWDWGLPNGLHQLFSANINSRYAGNFFEIIMTRSYFLKSIIMGITFWSIPWLITNLSINLDKKNFNEKEYISKKLYIFIWCNILLLSMPTNIWQQTYGWVAGFSNFVLSTLFFLIYLQIWYFIFEKKNLTEFSLILNFAIFIFAIFMQLFIENLTLITLFISIFFILIYYLQNKHFSLIEFLILLGNFIGAAIMFSSNIYGTLLNTGKAVNGYRQLTFNPNSSFINIISGFIKSFFLNIAPAIWQNNKILCCFISIVFIIYLIYLYGSISKGISRILIVLHIVFSLYYILNTAIECTHIFFDTQINYFHVIISWSFFFFILINLIIFKHYKPKNTYTALFLWLLTPLVMCPMVAINTVGLRSYFTTTCFLVVFSCTMLNSALNLVSTHTTLSNIIKKHIKKLKLVSFLLLFFICIFRGNVYYKIGQTNRERYVLIKNAITHNKNEFYLKNYPHEEYLWYPNPSNEQRLIFFKEFYRIPQNVEIHFNF